MEEVGVSSACRTDPQFTVGTQLPGGFGDKDEQAGGVWSVENAFNKLKDLDWLEYILTAKVAEAKALELC